MDAPKAKTDIQRAAHQRVSAKTPKQQEMSPAEKARFKREKTSSKKISYQHKRRKP